MWLGKSNQNPGGDMKKFVYLPERAVREPYPPGFVFSLRKSKLMSWRPEKLEQLMRNSVFGGMINKQERKNMLTKALPPLLWMNSKRSRQEKQLRLFSMCDKTRHIFFSTNKNSVIVTSCLSKYEVTILDFYSQLEGYKKGCKWSWLELAQALSYLPVPNSFFWVSHCGTLWLFWNKNLTRMLFLQGWYICRKKILSKDKYAT